MYQTPEQLIAMNKANLDVAMRFAGVAIEGAERLMDLQLKAAKTAFSDSFEGAKALAAVLKLLIASFPALATVANRQKAANIFAVILVGC